MSNWLEELSPEERASWDEYVDHARRVTLQGMTESAFVMSLVPDSELDVKFATEIGMAVLLDKPIVAIRQPGAKVSVTLEKIAYAVIDADIDTAASAAYVAKVIQRLTEELSGGG